MTIRVSLLGCALLSLLTACDQLGIETAAQTEARREAEGRAIGSACRQSGRALEDCYEMNPKAQKAAIFAGWKDMDGYMRENKIETIPPVAAEPVSKPAKKTVEGEDAAQAAPADAKPAASEAAPEKPAKKKQG